MAAAPRQATPRWRHVFVLVLALSAADAAKTLRGTLRVCTHKTCRKDGGGRELAARFSQIAQASAGVFEVEECGCLGNCGKGPNVAACLPDVDGGETVKVYNDVFKPATAAAIAEIAFGVAVPDEVVDAQVLNMKATRLCGQDRLGEAEALCRQGLELTRGMPQLALAHGALEATLERISSRLETE